MRCHHQPRRLGRGENWFAGSGDRNSNDHRHRHRRNTWPTLLGGHDSECDVTINPDGSVEAKIGSQDLGTGTRTTIGIVIAETLGLPFEAVKVELGKNSYPMSG